MASGDIGVKIRLALSDEGVAQKLARVGASAAGLRREFDQIAGSATTVRQRLGDGMDSMSRQLARIQSAVIAIGALFQGAGFVGSVAKTAAEFESLEAAMRQVFGSAKAAQQEMAHLKAESERLGVPLQTLAQSWLAFAAAARGTKLEGEAARDVFTALSEASVTLGLSQEQLSGALLAVQQMISKGAVSSEELRQQLGERLYGAVQIAARAVGIASDEFNKLLERGLIPVERFLPAFAAQLRRELGGGVADASNTARAAFARLDNAFLELKLEFARSGFMDALVAAARDLAAAFKDEQFRQSVRDFSQMMGALTRFVVEHGKELATLGGVIAGARTGAALGRIAGPKGALAGAGIGGLLGGLGVSSVLPDGTASGQDEKRVRDVEAAIGRLQRRIQQTREAAAAGLIKPDEAKRRIEADEAMIKTLMRPAATAVSAQPPADQSGFWRQLLKQAQDGQLTRLPALQERFDAELARLKDGLKTAESVIEESFKGRLITESQYWQAKAETQRRALDLEERDLREKLAAQQDLIARLSRVKPKDANQQAEIADRLREATNKAAELQARLDALDGRRVAVDLAIQVDRARLDKELADIKARLAQEFAQATGTETPEMRIAAIRREYEELLARFGDDPALRELVDRLVPVKAAQANLAALEAKWREAIERMRQAQDNANVLQQAGMLTPAQAQARIEAAAREAKGALEALLPDLEAAMRTLFPPEEVARRMENLRAEILKTQPVADSLMIKIAGQMQDAFASAFGDIVTGTKTVADAFSSMAQSILQSLARIFAQRAAQGMFDAILGSFGVRANAQGGVYSSASLAAYANRIVSAPTLFTFATGGIPRLGLMGEAGPEAIMPLTRGPDGRLGVQAHGAGNVVVNVSVDASGSKVEGDAGSARQLGDLIAGAVRGILVAEKRPGGLLAGA